MDEIPRFIRNAKSTLRGYGSSGTVIYVSLLVVFSAYFFFFRDFSRVINGTGVKISEKLCAIMGSQL
jgi:hypothetical protein